MGGTTPTMEAHAISWGPIRLTPAMRSARGPDGTGGNPKIGVLVHYSRPPIFFSLLLPLAALVALSPYPPFSHHAYPSALSPVTSVKINADLPYEDKRGHVLQTLPLDRSEGKRASRVREMACLYLPRSPSTSLPPSIVQPIPTPIFNSHPHYHYHSHRRLHPNPPLPPQSASSPNPNISPQSSSVSWSFMPSCHSLHFHPPPIPDHFTSSKTRSDRPNTKD
jgi:hypothetical protein